MRRGVRYSLDDARSSVRGYPTPCAARLARPVFLCRRVWICPLPSLPSPTTAPIIVNPSGYICRSNSLSNLNPAASRTRQACDLCLLPGQRRACNRCHAAHRCRHSPLALPILAPICAPCPLFGHLYIANPLVSSASPGQSPDRTNLSRCFFFNALKTVFWRLWTC